MFLNMMSNYVDILGLVSKKCLRFFSDFVGNLHVQKPNKAQTKKGKKMCVQYVCTYQQAVLTSYFILYQFYLLNTCTNLLFQSTPPPRFGWACKIIRPKRPPTAEQIQYDNDDAPLHCLTLRQLPHHCGHTQNYHPTPPTKTPPPPRLRKYFSGIDSDWNQQCLFLFIIMIYFLFTHP